MKHGREYAKRVKQLFQRMVREFGKPEPAEPTDPIEQVLVGILADCTSEAKAIAVYEKICQQMVDLNELRVTPAMELSELIGAGIPLAKEKAERIVSVLNEIRLRQDTLELSFLKQRGRREAREYLESLAGVGRSAAAWVVVHSLGGHAIPVDDLTLYVLRKDEIVDPDADTAEVQGFLERHVSAADCSMFAVLLNRHVNVHGPRVAISKLPELLNPSPPAPVEEAAPVVQKAASGASDKSATATAAQSSKSAARKKKADAATKSSTHGKGPGKAASKKTATSRKKPSSPSESRAAARRRLAAAKKKKA